MLYLFTFSIYFKQVILWYRFFFFFICEQNIVSLRRENKRILLQSRSSTSYTDDISSPCHMLFWHDKQFQRKLLPVSYKRLSTYLANFTVVAFRGTKPVWNWIWNIFIEAICWKQEIQGNCINPHEQYA